jgi:hypothetical protein
MNSLIQRYAGSSAASQAQRRNVSIVDDDDEFSDAMWGSEAGFGSLAKGVPSFMVPSVPDVGRRSLKGAFCLTLSIASCVFASPYGRSRGPVMQNQDSTWNNHTSIQIPGRRHCRCRFAGYSW